MPAPLTKAPSSSSGGDTVSGFFSNLVNGVGSTLLGLGESPYYLYQAGKNDVEQNGQPGLGSMLESIGKQYDNFYAKPVESGNFGQLAQNLYNDPVQPILDALTVATGGAGAAGKAGEIAAQAGDAGSALARAGEAIAGLQRLSPEEFDALPTVDRIGAKTAANGDKLLPKAYDIVSPTNVDANGEPVVLHTKPGGVSRNPVIRGRAALKEALMASPKLTGDDSIIGKLGGTHFAPDTRGPRLAAASAERIGKRALANLAKTTAVSAKALTPAEDAASFYKSIGFDTPKDYTDLVKARETQIADYKSAQAANGGSLPKAGARALAHLQSDAATLKDPAVSKLMLGGSDNLPAHVAQHIANVKNLSDEIQLVRGARDAAGSKEFGGHGMGDVESRAFQPLNTVSNIVHGDDYVPPEGKAEPAIISMSSSRTPTGVSSNVSRTVGGVMKSGEDKFSTGAAFRDALYKPTTKRIVSTAVQEMQHVSAVTRLQYLASVAAPIDPTDAHQAELIHSGVLTPVLTGSKLATEIGELADYVSTKLAGMGPEAESVASTLEAWKNAIDGEGIAVPAATLKALRRQVTDSSSILIKLLKTPNRVWRDLTLGLKGSFYLNCFFGHLLLGLVGYGPKFLKEAIVSGSERSSMGKAFAEHASNMLEHGDLPTTLAKDSMRDLPESTSKLGQVNPARIISILGQKAAHEGSKFTTVNFRRAAAAIEFKTAARSLAKADGIDAETAMQKILNDPAAIDHLAEKMYGSMLDYSKLTPFERDQIRAYYPFWNYMRAITGRTVKLTLDEPWKVEVMRQLSGQSLAKSDKTMFGNLPLSDVPEYDQGLLPIGKSKNGVTPELSTYGANLFSTPADLLTQLGGGFTQDAAGQSSPFAQINPFLGAAGEALTGQDFFTGEKLPGSAAKIFATQALNAFPQYSTYDNAAHPNPDALVLRNIQQRGEQYAGLPVGSFSLPNLEQQLSINDYYTTKQQAQWAKAAAKRAKDYTGPLAGVG